MSSTTAAPGAVLESRFRAMGTDVHLIVIGGEASMLALGEGRIRELEGRWSRFIDTSEVSLLNRATGRLVLLSADTFELVGRAVDAWRLSAGRCDPTVGPALAACGYDRDFDTITSPDQGSHTIRRRNPSARSPLSAHRRRQDSRDGRPLARPLGPDIGDPAPGLDGVELLPAIRGVVLPTGVTLDAGGLGKGLAADLTARLLTARGADGVLVNLGGDLRAIGRAPVPEGWVVTVPDPLNPERELLRLALHDGAVATSSRLVRRWSTTAGEAHHLIDPRTGRPAVTDVVAASVVAAEAWRAEALTKALFLAGPAALTELVGAAGLIVTVDGTRHCSPELEATLR